MTTNPLRDLGEAGQAVWLDFVQRTMLDKRELAAMTERDGVTGVTSNPSIFEKAIGSGDYDKALAPSWRPTTPIRPACSSGWRSRTSRPRPTSSAPCYDANGRPRRLSSAWKSRPIWRWTPKARWSRRAGCGRP